MTNTNESAARGNVMALRSQDDDLEMKEALQKYVAERNRRFAERPAIEKAGVEALKRLWPVAQSDTGQSGVVARFLLGCYNGRRFPFDLTDFRRLDYKLFEDCLAVLKMDKQPQQEVHRYFENGGQKFEQLAKDWGFSVNNTPDA
jgi:hypothetical protein